MIINIGKYEKKIQRDTDDEDLYGENVTVNKEKVAITGNYGEFSPNLNPPPTSNKFQMNVLIPE